MIGGDRVSETQETIGSLYISNFLGFWLQSLEERWVMNISGGFFPLELLIQGHFHGIPAVCSLTNAFVHLFK